MCSRDCSNRCTWCNVAVTEAESVACNLVVALSVMNHVTCSNVISLFQCLDTEIHVTETKSLGTKILVSISRD